MRNMLDKTNQKLKNIERKNNKGFTLVELIIVIAIIAVLAAVLAPQYIKYVEKSRVSADESTLAEVASAAKVALSDEDNNITLTAGNTTITVKNGVAVESSNDNLKNAINNALDKNPSLKSATYKTNGATCSITYTAATGTSAASYKFGTWSAVAAAPAG